GLPVQLADAGDGRLEGLGTDLETDAVTEYDPEAFGKLTLQLHFLGVTVRRPPLTLDQRVVCGKLVRPGEIGLALPPALLLRLVPPRQVFTVHGENATADHRR